MRDLFIILVLISLILFRVSRICPAKFVSLWVSISLPMKRIFAALFLFLALTSGSCEKPAPEPDPVPDPDPTPAISFAKGADVSWVTQMEKEGCRFYDAAGQQTECMALLKSLGMNAIRLRVWVNPTDGWCGRDDVVAKAKRAKALGLRVMIDFHYSDWWADPGKQNKPAAWKNLDLEGLKKAVADQVFAHVLLLDFLMMHQAILKNITVR